MAISVAILMVPGLSACAGKSVPDNNHALDCWSALTLTANTAQVVGGSTANQVEAVESARDEWKRLALSSGKKAGRSADDVIAAFGQRVATSDKQLQKFTSSVSGSGAVEMLNKNNERSVACSAELKK